MSEISVHLCVNDRQIILDKMECIAVQDSCSPLQTFLNPSAKTMNFSQFSQPQKKKKLKEGLGRRVDGRETAAWDTQWAENAVQANVSAKPRHSPLTCRSACKPRCTILPPSLAPVLPSHPFNAAVGPFFHVSLAFFPPMPVFSFLCFKNTWGNSAFTLCV